MSKNNSRIRFLFLSDIALGSQENCFGKVVKIQFVYFIVVYFSFYLNKNITLDDNIFFQKQSFDLGV